MSQPRIVSAIDAYYRRRPGVPPTRGMEWIAAYWQAPVPFASVGLRPGGPGTEIVAYVNHGRWVVDCPDCHAAQLACITDPRFLCNVCANVAIDGAWRRVIWPPNRTAIEAALMSRPDDATRNWLPGETVELLQIETEERVI